MNRFLLSLVILLLLVAAGCAKPVIPYMRPVSGNDLAIGPATEEMATIVIFRPKFLSETGEKWKRSTVFHLTDNGPVLVGLLNVPSRVTYHVPPGNHFFMVQDSYTHFAHKPPTTTAIKGDVLRAQLEPGKTYYACVDFWAPPFGPCGTNLYPVHKKDKGNSDIEKWMESCPEAELTDETRAYVEKHKAMLLMDKNSLMADWEEDKHEDLKRMNDDENLWPEDGFDH